MQFSLPPNKLAFFASDLHLRMAPDPASSEREKRFTAWLDAVSPDAAIIFLLGDIFDYWFDFRYVVPRGFVRLLGKMQELTERGIAIHYFAGNHDMWLTDYFSTELGIVVHHRPETCTINGKTFLIAHGHNLGPVSTSERLLNMIFTSRVLKPPFAAIHPYFTMKFGIWWSKHNRRHHATPDNPDGWKAQFSGVDNEYLAVYARQQLKQRHYDYFVFGHRHIAMDIQLTPTSRYINTGEWVTGDCYAQFDGHELELRSFAGQDKWLKL